MKLLTQKYHGLPGLGINGKVGEKGEKGQSVYFGQINEFFEGTELYIGTYIYAAKRALYDDITDYDTSTLALYVAEKELEVYPLDSSNMNNQWKNIAIIDSSDDLSSYVNYKTQYYTGLKLTDSKVTEGLYDPTDSSCQNFKEVELDLNGDYITMSLMLKTIIDGNNYVNENNINQYKSEYDYSIHSKNVDLTKPIKETTNLSDKYLGIGFEFTDYYFDDTAIIVGDSSHIPYDSNDIVYDSSSTYGEQFENGELLLNENASLYVNYFPENSTAKYVKDLDLDNELLGDANISYAEFNLMSNPDINTKYRSGKFINETSFWNELYKTSFTKTIYTDQNANNGDLYTKDILLDSKDNAFYGIHPSKLYSNRDTSNVSINQVSTGLNEVIPYYENLLKHGNQEYVNAILTTPEGIEICYSLNKNETSIQIPTTLNPQLKVGDIIYFYTDATKFSEDGLITHMAQITPDLIGCSPLQLVNSAVLQNPLNIKTIFSDNERVSIYNNAATIRNRKYENSSIFNYSNKSYISIVDNYTDSAVILSSNKQNSSANYSVNTVCAKTFNQNNNSYTDNIIDIAFKNNSSTDIVDISINSILKSNTLKVNDTNITNLTNVELSNKVYDSNIIFDSNHFVKPLSSLSLMVSKDEYNTAVFKEEINARDYFYNIDLLINYWYGCDIYNSKMEKIASFASQSETLDIYFVPNKDNEAYYIQMFASHDCGLKYYSKLTKVSVNYSKILYNKKRKVSLPPIYNSAIGKYSFSSIKSPTLEERYDTRYQLTSYNLETIGTDQKITKNKNTNNIIFSLSDLTAEKIENASLKVYSEDASIHISNILINHQAFGENTTITTKWASIEKVNDQEFILNLSTNLPNDCDTYANYVITDSSPNNIGESKLFEDYSNGVNHNSTNQRSFLVTVEYNYEDSSLEKFYENYNVVQPGFVDTRDIPTIELNTHNDINELTAFNSLENGVTANQFVTYLDINIKDFKQTWGQFINYKNINDIRLDIGISNIKYDLDYRDIYTISQLPQRTTFKTFLEDNDSSIINNYVKIAAFILETDENLLTLNSSNAKISGNLINIPDATYNVNQNFTLYVNKDSSVEATIVDDNILCNKNYIDANKNYEYVYTGLMDNIHIDISNIPVVDDIENIKLKLLVEMGNPMLANMYLRFVVDKITINVDSGDGDPKQFTTLIPDSSSNENNLKTYLFRSYELFDGAKTLKNLEYKYISNPIDIVFNPLSYIICPKDVESSYTNIYSSDVYKYGINEQIQKKLEFFNQKSYVVEDYTYEKIRKDYLYPYKLYINKSYVQDNIKAINVYPVSLYDSIKNIKTDDESLSTYIDSSLYEHNILNYIEGNKYLGIVYHSAIMQPKIRNGVYSFYYNDTECLKSKYDQKNNNLPVFAYDEESIILRDDDLINSMDKWNDYYAQYVDSSLKIYSGVLSLYGNGYMRFDSDDIKDVSIENCMSLEDVINSNKDEIISLNNISEVNIKPANNSQPNNEEYFRGFLYDINWEFPYYHHSQYITPYRVVSGFDNYLKNNHLNVSLTEYSNYYNALTESKLYKHNMIPYTLLFNINPRIAYNYNDNITHVLMLRRPSIGVDTDIINNSQEFKEKYEFNRRLFNLQNFEKLTNPYTVK